MMKEIPQIAQFAVRPANQARYPVTSLQELEQFTIPVAIHPSPFTDQLIYTTLHPTLPAEGKLLSIVID